MVFQNTRRLPDPTGQPMVGFSVGNRAGRRIGSIGFYLMYDLRAAWFCLFRRYGLGHHQQGDAYWTPKSDRVRLFASLRGHILTARSFTSRYASSGTTYFLFRINL
jgi:hypothetical protein